MISFKKSYAEQLLQLALALSLLHVDPESYLGRGWESQLELRNGDGWQLEMLRAVPITDYPYANRKAMMPLIEDLIRFDRQTNINDVTAYLLNVQDGGSNQTVSSQELDSSGGGAVSVEPSPVNNNSNVGLQEIDLFLNSDHFLEHESIIDQNLADLSEYGDIPLTYFPYYGLPLKDEPPEAFPPIDFNIETHQASTSSISGHGLLRSNGTGTVVTWSQINNSTREIKKEEEDKTSGGIVKQEPDLFKSLGSINEKNQASTSANEGQAETKISVKKEPKTEGEEETFESNVELTEEESEIVEVLWKQDVDLGYSLSPAKLINGDAATSTSSKSFDDEVEKLKALQELKEDKQSKDDPEKQDELDDEWAGIPFRIDNETGEYIRLPLQLDEILQDVLQLADLTTEDPEEPNNKDDKGDADGPTCKKNSEKSKTDGASNSSDGCPATVEPPQSEVEISSLPSPLFDLEDASELDDLDMMIQSAGPFQHHHRPGQNYATNSAFRQSGFHHHQSRVPLSRGVSMEQRLQDIANLFNPIPGMGVGMGVGDMSPYSHYPTHYPYQSAPGIPQHSQFPHPPHPVLHNASLADLGASQPHYGHNLGSAVTSSMHLTNSSHEADSGAAGYKMEHDMMYYSNTSSEINHTADGFINSFLNDEDLQLMDMGVNEGFCTMRMLEGNATSNNSSVLGSSSGGSHAGHLLSSMPSSLGTMTSEGITAGGDRLDASSDSAVSSMGSERVPSLSDGEWGDAGSDSAQEYHQGKYGGPYDYSYSSRLGDTSRQPVAQKKHQMFGKRYFQEQPNMPLSQAQSAAQPADHLATPIKYEYEPYGLHQNPGVGHNMDGAVGPLINKNHVPLMTNSEMKYACSLDFSARPPRSHDLISHNHTYTLPQGSGSTPRPQIRDKKQKKAEDEHLTRDEKRARSLSIPIAVHEIINLPMDEFNERLSKYDLTENQLSLIRDIRRRGKNKVAAQNCRKRKLDQILSLEDEVREVRRRKDRLYQDREVVLAERKRIANKFATLHRHVFQYLRDADGNPCSPSEYSLQQAADGSVYLLRRENNKPDGSSNSSGTNHTGNTNGHHQHSTQGPSPPSHHQKE